MWQKQSLIEKMVSQQNDIVQRTKFSHIFYKQQNCLNNNSQQFHIDCPNTKLKICFCDYLIKQYQSIEQEQLTNDLQIYMSDRYNRKLNIQEKDYQELEQQIDFVTQKLKRLQKKEDLYYLIPKLRDKVSKKLKIEKKQQKQEPKCYICASSKDTIEFKNPQNQQIMYACQECAQQYHPQLLAKQTTSQTIKKMKNSYINKGEKVDQQCYWQYCKKQSCSDDLLHCNNCKRSFHAKCCDPPLNRQLVNRFQYLCNECKLCVKCNQTNNEKELLICDACDRAFHMACLNIKMNVVPENQWYCNECQKCQSCKAKMDYSDPSLYHLFQEKYLLCKNCMQQVQNKNYCPICIKVIQNESSGDFIFCDKCQLWAHADCEGLNQMDLNKLNEDSKYECRICRIKQNII